MRSYRLQVDVQPEKYVAEEIIRALQQQTSVENLKFLLARAEGAREALSQQLTRLGAIVDEASPIARSLRRTTSPGAFSASVKRAPI